MKNRVKTVLSVNRTKLANSLAVGLVAGSAWLVTGAIADSYLQTGFMPSAHAQDDEEEGRRAPPSTRSANTLSRPVYTRIEEVQELRDEERYQEAMDAMAELRDLYDRDRLNNYEKYMMFLFYASLSVDMEREDDAVEYFEEALEIPELGLDQLAQLYRSLGQLYYAQERYEESIAILQQYLEVDENPNNGIYLQIAYGYYQLERYSEATPWIIRNMDAERAAGNTIPRTTYALLNSIYLILEDYPNARQLLREMIVLFDTPEDWTSYSQVDTAMDNLANSGYTLYMADLKGHLSREVQLVSLAYQMYGSDNPFGAAQVIEEGIAEGVIEENIDNLDFLSLCYQVAREDELAIEPVQKALAIEPSGKLYERLGQLYYNLERYEESIEAYNNALETGDSDREDQLLLRLANTYTQINQFDNAIDAARRAARADDRSGDMAQRYVTGFTQQKTRYETLQRQRRELAGFFE